MKDKHYHYLVSYVFIVGNNAGFTTSTCKLSHKMDKKFINHLEDEMKEINKFDTISLFSFNELECDCDD
jgi:hypothetical protein